jgi:hypothetical protein
MTLAVTTRREPLPTDGREEAPGCCLRRTGRRHPRRSRHCQRPRHGAPSVAVVALVGWVPEQSMPFPVSKSPTLRMWRLRNSRSPLRPSSIRLATGSGLAATCDLSWA